MTLLMCPQFHVVPPLLSLPVIFINAGPERGCVTGSQSRNTADRRVKVKIGFGRGSLAEDLSKEGIVRALCAQRSAHHGLVQVLFLMHFPGCFQIQVPTHGIRDPGRLSGGDLEGRHDNQT